MSFGDFDNFGGGQSNSGSGRDRNAFNDPLQSFPSLPDNNGSGDSESQSFQQQYRKHSDSIRNDIYAISANLASLQKTVALFGTPKDTHSMRDRLNGLIGSTQDIIKQCSSTDLRQLSQLLNRDPTESTKIRKAEFQKLSRDFKLALDRFQSVQRSVSQKSREFVVAAREEVQAREKEDEGMLYGRGQGDDLPLLRGEEKRQKELVQLDNEIEFNESIIEEREQSIQEIETTIHEVNEIFRDLGSLVTEQQGMVDNIETNIESAANRTGDATVELQGANRYQRKSRNRMCWLLGILLGVVVVLVILLVITRS